MQYILGISSRKWTSVFFLLITLILSLFLGSLTKMSKKPSATKNPSTTLPTDHFVETTTYETPVLEHFDNIHPLEPVLVDPHAHVTFPPTNETSQEISTKTAKHIFEQRSETFRT